MSVLKEKLKLKKNIKDQIEKEESKGNKQDTRLLNFYDLKYGEKMKVLIVPDVNGELWTHYWKHGPNLNLRGLEHISCSYRSNNEDCPACQRGFDYLDISREATDKKEEEAAKNEAKRWFSKDYTLMSVLVLDSPVDINESEDGNEVKLWIVPKKIQDIIRNQLKEGILDEEEICQTPFYIKKEKNQYNNADYSNSYFSRKGIKDEELEYFDDLTVEQFDYSNMDESLIPPPSTTEEVEEWLEKAIEKDEKKKAGDAKNASESDDEEEEEEKTPKKSTLTRRSSKKEPEPDSNDDESEEEDEDSETEQDPDKQEDDEEEETASKSSDKSDVKSRLDRIRNRKSK